jgi:SAF domain-containing protein
MLRSATFTIGLLLAGAAFVGFLMLGGVMAPPPYSVVVAVQDIPAYSTLNSGALGIDAQRINGQVARTLILRDEIDDYIGGFVLENIHAGEPLRKGAIVTKRNPQGIDRLALVMDEPDKVAMVIPVDAKTAPSQIASGDWVDLVVGLASGNISAGSNSTFSNLLTAPNSVSPILAFGPTPTGASRAGPIPTPTAPAPNLSSTTGNVSAGDMNLPADKVVIQNVAVLAVRFQQAPNPAFTGSASGLSSSQTGQGAQPAYIQGDVQSVTALVPRASVELITFGIDNGRVHLVLLPAKTAQAAKGAQTSTLGITFNDFVAWMMRERSVASGSQAQPAMQPTTAPGGAPQPTIAPTVQLTQPTRSVPNQPRVTPTPPETIPTGLDVGALLTMLLCGVVLLVLVVVIVRFIRKRRRDDALV